MNTDREQPYALTEGPLPKNIYTLQLEVLTKKMLENKRFRVSNDGWLLFEGEDKPYSINNIIKYANVQHVQFDLKYFELYDRYLSDHAREYHVLNQPEWRDAEQLQKKQAHFPLLHVAEMKAICIYTGEDYITINKLLRGKRDDCGLFSVSDLLDPSSDHFNLVIAMKAKLHPAYVLHKHNLYYININPDRTVNKTTVATLVDAAIENMFSQTFTPATERQLETIQSLTGHVPRMFQNEALKKNILNAVFCASGISHIAEETIDVSYRTERATEAMVNERKQAYNTQKPILIAGFISTTENHLQVNTESQESTILTQYTNLIGKRLGLLSAYPHEREYLIPPTQIQITHYIEHNEDGKTTQYELSARPVSDLATLNQEHMHTTEEDISPQPLLSELQQWRELKNHVESRLKNLSAILSTTQFRLSSNQRVFFDVEKLTQKIDAFKTNLHALEKDSAHLSMHDLNEIAQAVQVTESLSTTHRDLVNHMKDESSQDIKEKENQSTNPGNSQ